MSFTAMLLAVANTAPPTTGRGSGKMRKEKEYTEILADGPKTTRQIADALGITRAGGISSLHKLLKRGFVVKNGLTTKGEQTWGLRNAEF